MRLFLLRHAHTEKARGKTTDFERRIDEKGMGQLDLMKSYLRENYSDIPFQVFCSPARRTKTTFEQIRFSINIVSESYDHELYLPSGDNLLHYLWNADQKEDNVLVIAHNNGISEVASYLLEERTMLPTCGLVVIQFDGVEKLSEISKGIGVEADCFLPK